MTRTSYMASWSMSANHSTMTIKPANANHTTWKLDQVDPYGLTLSSHLPVSGATRVSTIALAGTVSRFGHLWIDVLSKLAQSSTADLLVDLEIVSLLNNRGMRLEPRTWLLGRSTLLTLLVKAT